MPKSNPKHIKKKVVYQRSKTLQKNTIPTRYWIMGVIGIIVISAAVVIAVSWDDITGQGNNDTNPQKISKVVDGCWVTMAYRIYYDKNNDGVIDYTGLDAEIYDQADIDHPFTTQVTTDRLILGWYRGLLGLTIGEEKYIDIEAFVDDNDDGRNDNSGEPPLGFTSDNHPLKYKHIIIFVHIVEIYAEEGFDPNTITYYPTTTFSNFNSKNNLFPSFFTYSSKMRKCAI